MLVLSEVSVMSNRTLTKHERKVVIVVEQTLNSTILTRLTLAAIIDAAVVSALRSQNDATTTERPQTSACVSTRFKLAAS